jgi:hypothetical protein
MENNQLKALITAILMAPHVRLPVFNESALDKQDREHVNERLVERAVIVAAAIVKEIE